MLKIILSHEKISHIPPTLDLNNIFLAWENRIKDLCIIYEQLKPFKKINKLLITECGSFS